MVIVAFVLKLCAGETAMAPTGRVLEDPLTYTCPVWSQAGPSAPDPYRACVMLGLLITGTATGPVSRRWWKMVGCQPRRPYYRTTILAGLSTQWQTRKD